MTNDERAIRKVMDDWFAATRAGDVSAILNCMTDDVDGGGSHATPICWGYPAEVRVSVA